MDSTVEIICENTNEILSVDMGTSLSGVLAMLNIENQIPFVAALVDNCIRELNYKIYCPLSIRFVDISHFEGMRVYERSMLFILQKAVLDTFPHAQLRVKNSVAKGTYCEIDELDELSSEMVAKIETRMREIVTQDIPILHKRMLSSRVEQIYADLGFEDKVTLLHTRPHLYVDVYTLGSLYGYFYGTLVPSTGFIKLFRLVKYHNGMHISGPQHSNPTQLNKIIPQDKMFDVFNEFKNWVDIIGVANVGDINQNILDGNTGEFIKIAEALHEKKLASIADMIHERNIDQGVRMVLISGPSSSGKTTFAKRLGIQLRVLGLKPVLISVDDYFVNRENTPKDENGEYDFESLGAVDVKSFTRDMEALMRGEMVDIPRYDFISGKRVYEDKMLQLDDRSVLIIEGIHGLNPKLTEGIGENVKFRIYLTALTSISMDDMTRVPTTDNRLIRRIVRDYRTRGNSAQDTIAMWGSVRRGEDKHIFPFQEQADVMFNSSLFYEISVLKSYVVPLLLEIPNTVVEYSEARRILRFLDTFVSIKDSNEVPTNSILREFIGGSSFSY